MKDSEGNFRTDVVLSDRDTHVPFSDKLRFVFLQLPCFKKEESECENDLDICIEKYGDIAEVAFQGS